jgi:tRNA-uridine 2-sulfurtransferase
MRNTNQKVFVSMSPNRIRGKRSSTGQGSGLNPTKRKVFVGMSPNQIREKRSGMGQGSGKRKGGVFVGMSGGVDSSVAAGLLKKRGYDVVGIHLRCYNVDGCAEQDAEDARRAAETLDIPFYVFDYEEEYKRRVVEYMVDGYKKGITPNPDVMCNNYIKFGIFLDRALELGADYIATGHYVRLRRHNPNIKMISECYEYLGHSDKNSKHSDYILSMAKDSSKDQSYFLWTLTQDQLRYCLFPIGNYLKSQVRELARKFNLPNAEKKDSQGICFLGQVKLEDFLKEYLPEKKGLVLSPEGERLGQHKGAHFYTVGQRHGLNLGIKNQELGISGQHDTQPHYVVAKNIEKNTVMVAEGKENPVLYKKEIELTDVNFISQESRNLLAPKLRRAGRQELKIWVRIRYRQSLVPAKLVLDDSGFKIRFDQPVKFVAPGQSAVFYNKTGAMIGGGIIT